MNTIAKNEEIIQITEELGNEVKGFFYSFFSAIAFIVLSIATSIFSILTTIELTAGVSALVSLLFFLIACFQLKSAIKHTKVIKSIRE